MFRWDEELLLSGKRCEKMNLNVKRKQETSRANKAVKNWGKESFFPKKMYKQPMIHEKILKSH